jgi:hypothetical protein
VRKLKRHVWKIAGGSVVVLALFMTIFLIYNLNNQESSLEVFSITGSQGTYDPLAAQKGKDSFSGEQRKPMKISISVIELNEDVQPVSLDSENRMPTPPGPLGVVWLETEHASPGWEGNAILTAHNSWNGTPGSFARLHELNLGNIVEFTYDDGSVGRFEVVKIDSYNTEEVEVPASVMINTGTTRTTLITCGGTRYLQGGFSHRIVILLEAIERFGADGQKIDG